MAILDPRPKLALSKARLYFCIYGLVALCTVNSYALSYRVRIAELESEQSESIDSGGEHHD